MDFCYLCARIFPRNPDPDSMRQGIFSYESSDGYLKTFATDDHCLANLILGCIAHFFLLQILHFRFTIVSFLVNDHKG